MSDILPHRQEKSEAAPLPEAMAVSPIIRLSELLADDMDAVNSEIIQRMQSDVALIPKLAGYLIAAGGKRIRPLLTLAATRLFDQKTIRAYPLAAAVEFIHTATLLHDDVVDGSEQRRGKTAANLVFGNQASVLVGDFLFSRAFQQMVSDGNLDVLRILSDASAIIAEGEVLQLAAQGDIELSLEHYYEVIGAKTAALFAAACEIGPVIAGKDKAATEALRAYGYNLGMAFQIADDVLDYRAERVKLGKEIGDDFREGKLTAPVILALTHADKTEREFWHRTMSELNQQDADLQQAMDIMAAHDSFEKGYELAMGFAYKACDALDFIEDTEMKSLLKSLAVYAVQRQN